MKPYAESCEQNKDVIIDVIRPLLADVGVVLEIGSGTGQHAVFFAEQMPHLVWHTSDRDDNHAGIRQWVDASGLANVRQALNLDVDQVDWPVLDCDVVFSANAVHIMGWSSVVNLFSGVGRLLSAGGLLILYGPFNYQGEYTSESNRSFDVWLKQRDSVSGIRDFEALDQLANEQGMSLCGDYEMPANNRVLCWEMGDIHPR